jgi:hypothetical protein
MTLAKRLCVVRGEQFGTEGVPEVARLLGLPPRTWLNYESGVTIPGEVLLKFIEITSVEPLWLLRGHGDRYRPVSDARPSRFHPTSRRPEGEELPRA